MENVVGIEETNCPFIKTRTTRVSDRHSRASGLRPSIDDITKRRTGTEVEEDQVLVVDMVEMLPFSVGVLGPNPALRNVVIF